jgi:hypothetical protein
MDVELLIAKLMPAAELAEGDPPYVARSVELRGGDLKLIITGLALLQAVRLAVEK